MHRCLKTYDIVHIITECLSLDPRYALASQQIEQSIKVNHLSPIAKDNRKALLSLSLTSKSLLEPCLDALWSCMLSARPLIDIMIPLAKQTRNYSETSFHGVMEFARFLDNTDMSRFYYYASRIKGLRVVSGDLNNLLSRVLSSRSSPRADPLLRNLRYLSWVDIETTSLSCIPLFAGPKLTSLKLYFGGDWPRECEGFLYAMFSSIRETCPLLETVETRHMMVSDVDWLNALIFSVFFNIMHAGFTCQPSFDTLMCLSSMPKLQTLHADSLPWSPFVWGMTSLLDFPSLRHLHWPALDYGEATIFLRRIQPRSHTRKIETIKIINRDFDTTEFVGFLDALRTTCSMQILSSIELWSSSLGQNMVDLSPAPSLLFPLFEFSCIEVLEINNLPIKFDDAFLAAASTAWPRLCVLRLTPLRLKDSGVTLAGLALLSVQSRCLEKLELDITNWSSNVLFPPAQGGNGIEATSLTSSVTINHPLNYFSKERVEWEMQGSAIQDEQGAAKIEIIKSIFPNAKVAYNWLYYR